MFLLIWNKVTIFVEGKLCQTLTRLFKLHITTKTKLYMISVSTVLLFWDPMNCSRPGSSVHGIFQVRLLE